MRRAGIYFFYDKDGIVDRYIPYFLKELNKVIDYLVIVINGKLSADGREMLTEVSDDLFVRENEGFDAWAYKTALEYIGWDELWKYDELVISNYTTFGPIYPFQSAFDKMKMVDCDFWSMVSVYENRSINNWNGVPLKWGYRPDHLCNNFLVFRSEILHSYEFRRFWEDLPPINNYYEAGVYGEMSLTSDFRDAGFKSAALDEGGLRGQFPSPAVSGAYALVTQYQVPIIRKKAFFDPNCPLDYCTDIPQKLMDFISNYTQYDCNLIWENLLRTVNQYDLKNWFNWNCILPVEYSKQIKAGTRIAVIFHAYYEDIIGQYLHNIESFPNGTDFYFTTDTLGKQEALEKLLSPLNSRFHIEYRLVENRGRDVSALLVGCRDVVLEGGYDLICFMHDKKGIGNSSGYSCVGHSFSDCCFENVAASADYVNNVISLFQQQPRLGIAVPPPPKNAGYYKVIGGSWTVNYQKVMQLLCELNQCIPLDKKKPPVAPYGSVFWFRPDALLPLFEKEWQYDDFSAEPMRGDGTVSNAIERVHSLIAQGRGYYPSIIMSTIYAEQEVTRMTEIAHTYVDFTLQYAGAKMTLNQATAQFAQILQNKKKTTSANSNRSKALPSAPIVLPAKARGPLKGFVRWICPIGLWNLLRRYKCKEIGWTYVDEDKTAPLGKKVVKACFPRGIWNGLRRLKCAVTGGVYREDEM